MSAKKLALALIATATVACGASSVEESGDGTKDPLTQESFPHDSGCVVTANDGTLFGQYLRVRFRQGERGAFAMVEKYDGQTGFAGDYDYYQYKRLENGDVLLYEAHTGMNIQKARLRVTGDDTVWETIHEDDHLMSDRPSREPRISATHAMKCDLTAGAPSLSLPVAQRPAATQELSASSKFTFGSTRQGDEASCVGSQLLRGQVLRVVAHGAYRDPDSFLRVELYDPTTHFLAEDLLAEKQEPAWSYVGGDYVLTSKYRDNHLEHARLVKSVVDGKLQFVLKPVELYSLTSDITMSCDFVE